MAQDLENIGLAAVDEFINTFNSRNADQWANSLNFPHVRPSPFGPVNVAETKEIYVDQASYDRIIDSGWDHTEWDYKRVIHTSSDKIHVAGQWSRYTKEGDKILTTPVVYVVTNNDGHWGIQSRFGCDYAGEDDTSGLESRAFNLLTTFVFQYNKKSEAVCRECLNYPHFEIGVGHLTRNATLTDYSIGSEEIDIRSMVALQTGKHSINVGMDITLIADSANSDFQAVINITDRDDHLGIQAWSLLEPADVE